MTVDTPRPASRYNPIAMNRACFTAFSPLRFRRLSARTCSSAASRPDDSATITLCEPATLDPGRAMSARRQVAWRRGGQQIHPTNIDDPPPNAPSAAAGPPDSTDAKELRRFARRQIVTLASNKMLRASYSERQLQEVLVDFWFNHFNVYAAKGRTAQYLPAYESEVIRPHVFDHFRDLLEATAKSPAMLFYLDNWLGRIRMRRACRRAAQRRGFGARPLRCTASQRRRREGRRKRAGSMKTKVPRGLELHARVDGGKQQMSSPSRVGLTVATTDGNSGSYRSCRKGTEVVLGPPIKSGRGDRRWRRRARHLASHPSTRIKSSRAAPRMWPNGRGRGRSRGGALPQNERRPAGGRADDPDVPEFLATAARDAKFKTPFELVVSAVRTTGADVSDGRPFVQVLQQLGQPLYMCQPPTGYRDTADAWVSAGGLVSRMNFATRLASGGMPGVTLPPDVAPSSELALRLGSPEFQRH